MTLTFEQIIKEAELVVQGKKEKLLEKQSYDVVAELVATRLETGIDKPIEKVAALNVAGLLTNFTANKGLRNAAIGAAGGVGAGLIGGEKDHKLKAAITGGLLGGAAGAAGSLVPKGTIKDIATKVGLPQTKRFKATDRFIKTIVPNKTSTEAPGLLAGLRDTLQRTKESVSRGFKPLERNSAFDPNFVSKTKAFDKVAFDWSTLAPIVKGIGNAIMENKGARNMAIGAATGVVGGAIAGGKDRRLSGALKGGLMGTAGGAAFSAAPHIKTLLPATVAP
jgi:hypothetical protein